MNFQQRHAFIQEKNKRQLIKSLFHEANILMQYLNDRNADAKKASDREFVPLPDTPVEHELKAAFKVKKIIGQLYGI